MELETPMPDGVLDDQVLARIRKLGGEPLLAQMIDLFLEHGAQRLAAALDAERAGDRAEVERATHSLKSTAGNLGAHALQLSAERIEHLAATEDPSALATLMREMEARFAEARTALERERAGLST